MYYKCDSTVQQLHTDTHTHDKIIQYTVGKIKLKNCQYILYLDKLLQG